MIQSLSGVCLDQFLHFFEKNRFLAKKETDLTIYARTFPQKQGLVTTKRLGLLVPVIQPIRLPVNRVSRRKNSSGTLPVLFFRYSSSGVPACRSYCRDRCNNGRCPPAPRLPR